MLRICVRGDGAVTSLRRGSAQGRSQIGHYVRFPKRESSSLDGLSRRRAPPMVRCSVDKLRYNKRIRVRLVHDSATPGPDKASVSYVERRGVSQIH